MPEENGYFNKYIEDRFKRVEEDIKLILTNHLPHINDKLDNIQKWLIATLTTALFALLALSLNLIFKR